MKIIMYPNNYTFNKYIFLNLYIVTNIYKISINMELILGNGI